jgi:hypothetical protein
MEQSRQRIQKSEIQEYYHLNEEGVLQEKKANQWVLLHGNKIKSSIC